MKNGRWARFIGPVILVGLIVAGILLVAGNGHRSRITVQGQLALAPATAQQAHRHEKNFSGAGTECHGVGQFEGVDLGSIVTIENAAHVTVGSANLDQGSLLTGRCVFDFAAPNVPFSHTYYVSFDFDPHRHLKIDVTEAERGADIELSRR